MFPRLFLILAVWSFSFAWMAEAGLEKARISVPSSQSINSVETRIDWPSFLADKDLIWKKAPKHWENAPFLGNGFIGMQIMQDAHDKSILRVEVARMDAQEHLPLGSPEDGTGDSLYTRYRVPIGYFSLNLGEEISGWDLRLDLWNAELKGTITTKSGIKRALTAYAHAEIPVLLVQLSRNSTESAVQWQWNAYKNESPRTHSWGKDQGKKDAPNAQPGAPGQEIKAEQNITAWKQPLRPSGLVATAWQVKQTPQNDSLYISIEHSYPDQTALDKSVATVGKAVQTPVDELTRAHQQWWHDYYPESFVSLPDAYWDSFYWIQMYKIGAGMREHGPVLDLQGPWTGLPVNAWPGVWWNLNVQLTYWPCYTGNRLKAATSLSNTLKKYRENLINNVSEPYRNDSAGIPRASGPDASQSTGIPGAKRHGSEAEVGSFTWTCHNLFLQYRMTMDDEFLKEEVYPLLRRAINYYMHFLETGEDGKLHLPPTLSPEYGVAPDANYDLSLLRWGCQTLLWSAKRLNINDPLIPKWKKILETLTDYPVNENGYMVGKGVPFKHSHRHFSHLFMVFPLHLVDTSLPGNAVLMDKSIRHWHSLKSGLMGYSFTGGASMYAALQRGDEALEMLDGLKRYVKPNTLYRETWPVIETPLSGAASIHDMLLQSWNGLVNVLPAVPAAWGDVSFHHLRAEGAFLVSAERKNGVTQWIHIKSLAGEPLRLRTGMLDTAKVSGSGAASLKKEAKGEWVGIPAKESEVFITLPGVTPAVSPVRKADAGHRFGLP